MTAWVNAMVGGAVGALIMWALLRLQDDLHLQRNLRRLNRVMPTSGLLRMAEDIAEDQEGAENEQVGDQDII